MLRFPHDILKEHIQGDRFKEFANYSIDEGTTTEEMSYLLHCSTHGILFIKTDYLHLAFDILRDSIRNYVLVSHHSDFSIDEKYVLITHTSGFPIDSQRAGKRPDCIKRWFAQNKMINDDNIVALPLGLEPPNRGVSGDVSVLARQLAQSREIQGLCYMNHSRTTNPDTRVAPWEWGVQQSWIDATESRVPFPVFIENLYSHKFVISPPGNGVDCLKHWEAMYMGCIPIVMRSILMDEFAQDLPMLVVDKWEDVTEELLNKTWEEYNAREWNYEKMTISYWRKRITQARDEVCHD